MGVPRAALRQIAKRIKIPNIEIVTISPPIHAPIIHRMRLISRRAKSASRFAMSVQSLSRAVSFFGTSARKLSRALPYFA